MTHEYFKVTWIVRPWVYIYVPSISTTTGVWLLSMVQQHLKNVMIISKIIETKNRS